MRRFTNPTAFKHSHRPVLSFEEYEVVKAEAAQDLAEIQASEAEAERAMDTADSLEDLVAVADTVDAATPTEVALVQVAGDIATAGTDMTSEEIVPVGESYIGRGIATEGIVDTVKKIWASIKKFVKDMWSKVTSWFNKFFGTLPNLRKRIEALRKRLEEIQNGSYKLEGDNKKFTLTNVSAVTVENTPIKDGKGIIAALKNEYVTKDFLTDSKGVTKNLETLLDELEAIDTSKPVEVMASGLDVGGFLLKVYDEVGVKAVKDGDYSKKVEFGLLGNKGVGVYVKLITNGDSLEVEVKDKTKVNRSDKKTRIEFDRHISRLRVYIDKLKSTHPDFCAKAIKIIDDVVQKGDYSKVILINTIANTIASSFKFRLVEPDTKKKLPDDIQFTTLTTSDIDAMLEVSEEILDNLETYEKSSSKKDADKLRERFDKFCDSLDKDISKIDIDEVKENMPGKDEANYDEAVAIKEYHRLAKLLYRSNNSISSILIFLNSTLINHYADALRTALMLCDKSLSLYTKS